jgi:hypothetical protein
VNEILEFLETNPIPLTLGLLSWYGLPAGLPETYYQLVPDKVGYKKTHKIEFVI